VVEPRGGISGTASVVLTAVYGLAFDFNRLGFMQHVNSPSPATVTGFLRGLGWHVYGTGTRTSKVVLVALTGQWVLAGGLVR